MGTDQLKHMTSLQSNAMWCSITDFLMALDAKVAGVAQAVAAAQKWKKGLFADVDPSLYYL